MKLAHDFIKVIFVKSKGIDSGRYIEEENPDNNLFNRLQEELNRQHGERGIDLSPNFQWDMHGLCIAVYSYDRRDTYYTVFFKCDEAGNLKEIEISRN